MKINTFLHKIIILWVLHNENRKVKFLNRSMQLETDFSNCIDCYCAHANGSADANYVASIRTAYAQLSISNQNSPYRVLQACVHCSVNFESCNTQLLVCCELTSKWFLSFALKFWLLFLEQNFSIEVWASAFMCLPFHRKSYAVTLLALCRML